jgi:hypothetical protein
MKKAKTKKAVRRPGPEFTEVVKCKDCKKSRFVMPQDVFHCKRCKDCQQVWDRHNRKLRMRKYRAAAKKQAKVA